MKTIINTDKKIGNMNYKIYVPEKFYDMDPEGSNDLPLIVYLHGAGERGEVLDHIDRHAIPKLIKEGRSYDAIILAPQCPRGVIWNNIVRELKELIDDIVSEYNVKNDRITITGSSMGGCGTLEMCMTYPSFFAAIAPVASQCLGWRTPRMYKTPVYLYHGTDDTAVLYECSVKTKEILDRHSGICELITLEHMEHNDGIDYAYRNTDLIEKLIKARRTDFSYVPDMCEEYY